MSRNRVRLALVTAIAAALVLAQDARAQQASVSPATPTPTPRPRGAGIGIGSLAWLDREFERAELPAKASWQRLRAGDPLRTGDTFRTGPEATARLEFPWMAVTLGGGTLLAIPASTVLSTVLEQGRAEFAGPGREIVKIRVGDGEVRGGGRLVLRRLLKAIAKVAIVIKTKPHLHLLADEPDNRVLECAEAVSADFIVTGDKHLILKQFQNSNVIRLSDFLKKF